MGSLKEGIIAILQVANAFLAALVASLSGISLTLVIPVLRALSAACFIVAAVALASDLSTTTRVKPSAFQTTSVIEHWHTVAPNSLETTRTYLIKRTRPWIWDAVSAPLRLPAFGFFVLIGSLIGYLGRRRKRINIFAN